jgi:hypothetical protein
MNQLTATAGHCPKKHPLSPVLPERMHPEFGAKPIDHHVGRFLVHHVPLQRPRRVCQHLQWL